MTTIKKLKKRRIQLSDPGKILDLIMSLTGEKCADIQIRMNKYLCRECEADVALQVMVDRDRNEAFIEVVGTNILRRKMKINLTQKFNETLKSQAEQVEDLSEFDQDFQTIVAPYVPKDKKKNPVEMYPVIDTPFSVIFCVVSSKIQEGHVPVLIRECGQFTWPTLKKSIALEHESTMKMKCQQLLRVAKRLITQVASLETLLQIAMEQVKMLTKAEYCCVMLIDMDKMEVYDSSPTLQGAKQRRFPLDVGITGEVIKTGALINTRSAEKHPSFNPAIDSKPNIKCKNLLFFPIREQSGIIGVGQLMNKSVDPYFDGIDEEMALAFSIYCGICIIHSVIYQKIQEAHIRNALANELVMYHMKVNDAEVTRMLSCTGFHNQPHFSSLLFECRSLPLRELPCYAMRMFTELGFDKKFDLKPNKLARFLLYVKKSYRDVPYHNWHHSFNVAHWAYAALVTYKLVAQGYFTDLQAFMYLVACLTHDIDHRGTTNSFQINGQTNLGALYSSEGSVMERHHLSQAMCILNMEDSNILESLSRRDYDKAIMMLRDNILATDLANYFKNFNEFKVVSMDFQKGNRYHFTTLQSLLMNAADLGDQLKDWGSVKKTAAAVLTEFFKQGEMEKMRGDKPALSMDRDRCFIPDLEIEFIQSICLPLYDLLSTIIPTAAVFKPILESHLERWEASRSVFSEVPVTAGLSALLSPELDTLIDLNIKERKEKEARRLAEEEEENEAEYEDDKY